MELIAVSFLHLQTLIKDTKLPKPAQLIIFLNVVPAYYRFPTLRKPRVRRSCLFKQAHLCASAFSVSHNGVVDVRRIRRALRSF